MGTRKHNPSQKEYRLLLERRLEFTNKQINSALEEANFKANPQQKQRLQSLEDLAEKISLALARLSGNHYGICLFCGNPIEERRLRMIPETDFCLSCQLKNERQRRRSS